MNVKTLKIVVSGPVGAGKTTLVHALGERWGVPVIEEGYTAMLEAEHYSRLAMSDSAATPEERKQRNLDWMNAIVAWADRRRELYAASEGFVADRWEADLIDQWLVKFGSRASDKITARLLRDMREKSEALDFAVMLPLRPPMGGITNADDPNLLRVNSFSGRLLNSLLTRGLIQTCPGLRMISIPARVSSLEERVKYIEAAVQRGGAKAAVPAD